jgi:hypothetical protein
MSEKAYCIAVNIMACMHFGNSTRVMCVHVLLWANQAPIALNLRVAFIGGESARRRHRAYLGNIYVAFAAAEYFIVCLWIER